MQAEVDERKKQVIVGVGILSVLTAAVAVAVLGWRHLPGLLGEWVGLLVGVISTPFLLEASFLILGLVIVVWLNHRRARREGEEFVMMEVEVPEGARAEGAKVDQG